VYHVIKINIENTTALVGYVKKFERLTEASLY
jgi:hypothetical protein